MTALYLPLFVTLLVSAVVTLAMFLLGHYVARRKQSALKQMPFECGNETQGARGSRPV